MLKKFWQMFKNKKRLKLKWKRTSVTHNAYQVDALHIYIYQPRWRFESRDIFSLNAGQNTFNSDNNENFLNRMVKTVSIQRKITKT